jgi:hypothetical protein
MDGEHFENALLSNVELGVVPGVPNAGISYLSVLSFQIRQRRHATASTLGLSLRLNGEERKQAGGRN